MCGHFLAMSFRFICLPRSRTISLTMYLSMPLLCSGCRNERNSSSFSSWSAGGLSAWNQRSFKLSRTSWAVVRPYFIHIVRNGFVRSTRPYLTNASSTLKLTFFIYFEFFIVFDLLSHFFFIETFTGQKLHTVFIPSYMSWERAQFEKLAVKTIVKCYEIIMADVKNNIQEPFEHRTYL